MLVFSHEGVYNTTYKVIKHKALMETDTRHFLQSERRTVKAPQAESCVQSLRSRSFQKRIFAE